MRYALAVLSVASLALTAPAGCAPTPTLPLDDAASDVADVSLDTSTDTRPQVCTPGAQVACACVGGAAGAQVCMDDGTTLGPCMCPDGGMAVDVADASAGMDAADASETGADATETGIEGGVDSGVDVSIDLTTDTPADSPTDALEDSPTDARADAADACLTDANLSLDPLNCGTCGTRCTAPTNAAPRCTLGACAWSCSSGFGDCNGESADGCETSLRSDANCGMCGRRCEVPNSVSMCTGVACAITSCMPGYSNCDGEMPNGCEVNTRNDVNNCGSCTNRCVLPHANAACSSGTCALDSCMAGFFNCDRMAANGCESASPCP